MGEEGSSKKYKESFEKFKNRLSGKLTVNKKKEGKQNREVCQVWVYYIMLIIKGDKTEALASSSPQNKVGKEYRS